MRSLWKFERVIIPCCLLECSSTNSSSKISIGHYEVEQGTGSNCKFNHIQKLYIITRKITSKVSNFAKSGDVFMDNV